MPSHHSSSPPTLKLQGYLRKPNFKRSEQYRDHRSRTLISRVLSQFTHYKVRWFILDLQQCALTYYEDDRFDRLALGRINMHDVLSIQPSEVADAPQFSIDIVTETRLFTVAADSEQTLAQWTQALRMAIDYAKSHPVESSNESGKESQSKQNSSNNNNNGKTNRLSPISENHEQTVEEDGNYEREKSDKSDKGGSWNPANILVGAFASGSAGEDDGKNKKTNSWNPISMVSNTVSDLSPFSFGGGSDSDVKDTEKSFQKLLLKAKQRFAEKGIEGSIDLEYSIGMLTSGLSCEISNEEEGDEEGGSETATAAAEESGEKESFSALVTAAIPAIDMLLAKIIFRGRGWQRSKTSEFVSIYDSINLSVPFPFANLVSLTITLTASLKSVTAHLAREAAKPKNEKSMSFKMFDTN